MDHITVAQAAAIIGISPRQVRQYITDGSLPAEPINDRLYMVPRAAAEAFKRRPRGNPNFVRTKKRKKR